MADDLYESVVIGEKAPGGGKWIVLGKYLPDHSGGILPGRDQVVPLVLSPESSQTEGQTPRRNAGKPNPSDQKS